MTVFIRLEIVELERVFVPQKPEPLFPELQLVLFEATSHLNQIILEVAHRHLQGFLDVHNVLGRVGLLPLLVIANIYHELNLRIALILLQPDFLRLKGHVQIKPLKLNRIQLLFMGIDLTVTPDVELTLLLPLTLLDEHPGL